MKDLIRVLDGALTELKKYQCEYFHTTIKEQGRTPTEVEMNTYLMDKYNKYFAENYKWHTLQIHQQTKHSLI